MPIRNVLVAIDGSKEAAKALQFALMEAKQHGARITIVSVAPFHPIPEGLAPAGMPYIEEAETAVHQQVLDKAQETARDFGVSSVDAILLHGLVADEIIGAAQKKLPDLLVLGARGLSPSKRFFLGSVSDAVVHHAPCPVLIVRS